MNYLGNTPLLAAGISKDNLLGLEMVRKINICREVKLRGQLWYFEDHLQSENIIPMSQKGLIYF